MCIERRSLAPVSSRTIERGSMRIKAIDADESSVVCQKKGGGSSRNGRECLNGWASSGETASLSVPAPSGAAAGVRIHPGVNVGKVPMIPVRYYRRICELRTGGQDSGAGQCIARERRCNSVVVKVSGRSRSCRDCAAGKRSGHRCDAVWLAPGGVGCAVCGPGKNLCQRSRRHGVSSAEKYVPAGGLTGVGAEMGAVCF